MYKPSFRVVALVSIIKKERTAKTGLKNDHRSFDRCATSFPGIFFHFFLIFEERKNLGNEVGHSKVIFVHRI